MANSLLGIIFMAKAYDNCLSAPALPEEVSGGKGTREKDSGEKDSGEKNPEESTCVKCGDTVDRCIYVENRTFCEECFMLKYPNAPYCTKCGITNYVDPGEEECNFDNHNGGADICRICLSYETQW